MVVIAVIKILLLHYVKNQAVCMVWVPKSSPVVSIRYGTHSGILQKYEISTLVSNMDNGHLTRCMDICHLKRGCLPPEHRVRGNDAFSLQQLSSCSYWYYYSLK